MLSQHRFVLTIFFIRNLMYCGILNQQLYNNTLYKYFGSCYIQLRYRIIQQNFLVVVTP